MVWTLLGALCCPHTHHVHLVNTTGTNAHYQQQRGATAVTRPVKAYLSVLLIEVTLKTFFFGLHPTEC